MRNKLIKNEIKNEDIQDILNSEDKLKILLDTNVLIAYFDKDHDFNYVASTIIDPLRDKNCYFFIPTIVFGEFINKWMELKKVSVTQAINLINNFINTSLRFSLIGGASVTPDQIISSFKAHAKHKNFLKAHFNDFMILIGAESIKNIKIITCDKEMHTAGRTIFKKNIYFIPFNNKKVSELSRFVDDMSKFSV